jgi:hypothetical protein
MHLGSKIFLVFALLASAGTSLAATAPANPPAAAPAAATSFASPFHYSNRSSLTATSNATTASTLLSSRHQASIFTRRSVWVRSGCSEGAFALAIRFIAVKAHAAVRVPPTRAFILDAAVADFNRLQPIMAAGITRVTASKCMATDFRVIKLPTVQGGFTRCLATIFTCRSVWVRSSCSEGAFTLAIRCIAVKAHAAIRVSPTCAFILDAPVADRNRLQPIMAAGIARVTASKCMATDFRVIKLPTVQGNFARCWRRRRWNTRRWFTRRRWRWRWSWGAGRRSWDSLQEYCVDDVHHTVRGN